MLRGSSHGAPRSLRNPVTRVRVCEPSGFLDNWKDSSILGTIRRYQGVMKSGKPGPVRNCQEIADNQAYWCTKLQTEEGCAKE